MKIVLAFIFLNLSGNLLAQSKTEMLLNAERMAAKGDTTASIQEFRQVLLHYPQSFAATMRLAELHYHLKDYTTAILYCNIALDITDNYEEKAMENLTDSLPASSEVATIKNNIKQYQLHEADIHHLKGLIRLRQYRRNDAIEEFKKALDIKVSSNTLTDLALIYLETGFLQDALKLLHQARALEPETYKPYFNLGNVHYKVQNMDSALHYYKIAQEKAPDLKWPYLYSGIIHTENKQYESAIDQFTRFISIDSTREETFFRRAVLYSELGQWQNALGDWNQILELNPSNAEAWRNKGLTFFRLEKYDSAITAFNEALTLMPDEPYTYINRGYTYYLSDQPEKALADLDLGLKELPKYYLGYYFRALTHLQLNKKKKACSDLSKALSLGMKEAEVDKKLLRKCF